MQPGEWRELPTTGLERDLLYTDAAGDTGSTAHTDWSDELSWDPTTETAYYLGAGHLRPFGFLRYEAASNAWCREDQGLPSCMYVGGYDGCFSHGYDQGALDATRHLFYFNSWLRLFAYDTSVKTWTEHALPEGSPVGYGSVLEYFPPADKLFVFIGGDAVLNAVGGANQPVATGLPTGPYSNVATYSPLHRKLIFGGGNGLGRLYELDESLNVTQVPDDKGLPDGVPNLAHVGMTTLTADPVTGDVLFLSTALTFHAYDPGARAWRHLADPPFRDYAAPADEVANGQVNHHVLAAPIDSYGVVLFMLPQDRYQIFVYKHD